MPDARETLGTSLRLPPANIEAEQALLGALLANNKAFERVAEFLRPEHFADPLHGAVYRAIARRIEAGQLADAVTLRAEFEHNGMLDSAGGVVYLAQLLGAMVGIINAGEYGRAIHDCWLRRQLVDLGEVVVNRAFGAEPEMDARAQLEAADALLHGLSQGQVADGMREGADVARALSARVDRAIALKGALPGLTYGLCGLDRMTGGMRPGQFILVAGRPSMGKTSMGLRIALGAAEALDAGGCVLFISAEMISENVMARAAVAEAGLPMSAYTHGGLDGPDGHFRTLTEAEALRLDGAARRLGALPIVWDDQAVTIAAIRARARRLQAKRGLRAIVIDYLGRLRASSDAQRFGLNNVVVELSAGLKDLAKQLGVPVVCLAQLSRKVEERDDKTPLLSDLRDSGSLEQDADVVMFLYREHYYLLRSRPQKTGKEKVGDFEARVLAWEERMAQAKGRATVIIAKQRQGRIGPVRLRWDDDTAQFRDEDSRQED